MTTQDRVHVAFEQLHRAYFDDVRRFIERRVRDRQLAEDLAQETFLRAFRSWHALDPSRPPWPWLRAIARNLLINSVRDSGRRPVTTNDPWDDHGVPTTDRDTQPDTWISSTQRRKVISKTLAELSPRERRVLMLRCERELSYEQIAKTEDLTIDALKSLLKRARLRFRAAYARVSAELEGFLPFPFKRTRGVMRLTGSDQIAASAPLLGVVGELILLATLAAASLVGTSPEVVSPSLERSAAMTVRQPGAELRTRVTSSARHEGERARTAPKNDRVVGASISGGIDDSRKDRRTVGISTREEHPVAEEEHGIDVFFELPCFLGADDPLCAATGFP